MWQGLTSHQPNEFVTRNKEAVAQNNPQTFILAECNTNEMIWKRITMLIILPCHFNAVLVCVIFIIKHWWGGTCISKFSLLESYRPPFHCSTFKIKSVNLHGKPISYLSKMLKDILSQIAMSVMFQQIQWKYKNILIFFK